MRLLISCAGALALLVFAEGSLVAGTTGKIAGEVKDSQTGEALIGVNVIVEGTTYGAATNIEGYFVILNLAPGKYTLSASAIGYNKKTFTGVSVSVDLTTTQDFTLVPTVVEVGEEIVVTAERPIIRRDLTSSESRVDAAQIARLPVSEVGEVLALQAGITLDRSGGIHIRGGRTSEVAYWVDGISISDVYDGSQAVQVDNHSVQELQVISGTFNAEFGQAMSGIVNIVTKDGDQQLRGSVSSYVGDYITSDKDIFFNLDSYEPFDNKNFEASVSGPVPGLSGLTFYLSGRYFKTDGWLYGNRVFHPDGSLATIVEPVFVNGVLTTIRAAKNPQPMNNRERWSGQGKLTFPIGGSMKLNLSGLYSKIDFRDYSHDWRITPDGDVKKFDRGYNLSALWTHTLGPTSFYTLNLSYFKKTFREYLFENPLDPRYLTDPNLQARPLQHFIFIGTNLHQFKRFTETRVAKLDYTDQISRQHQLKAGVEAKLHRLYLEDYNVAPALDRTGNYIPAFPVRTGPDYQEYTRVPVEFSAYAQDKLEYERMVVNVGVRFDYFNSKGQILADPEDPNVYLPQKPQNIYHDLNGNGRRDPGEPLTTAEERLAYWYKDAKAKYNVSPRFGISYPITDRGVLHFSYGHFLQIPSFIHLYQRPEYKVTTASGVQGIYGNPDLNAQKTVMYEFGLQQQVADDLSFDVTGFYRDTRDWVTTSAQIPVRDPETATTYYTIYTNRDYANSRGVTLSINKRPSAMWTMNLSYTFQTAEGNNSNPDDEDAAQRANREPARSLTPLDWDQTHTANVTVGIGEDDWGVFVLGRYGSGLPYTPVVNQAEGRGEDAARIVQRNSRRRPENYTVDLRLFKNFRIDPLNLSFFVKVFNVFDRRNELEVFGETGRATATPRALGINVAGENRVNTVEEFLVRPDYYSEPREIQIGLEINF